jgi:hypothetical protein
LIDHTQESFATLDNTKLTDIRDSLKAQNASLEEKIALTAKEVREPLQAKCSELDQ